MFLFIRKFTELTRKNVFNIVLKFCKIFNFENVKKYIHFRENKKIT